MPVAVIDMGTNTFNLAIGERGEDGRLNRLYSKFLPAKLGEGGINSNYIAPEAFERGVNVFLHHLDVAKEYHCTKITAFATSAIRHASNGKEFTDRLESLSGIKTVVVDGNREAELIYKGVTISLPWENKDEVFLILDIGGGSNELIIANKCEVFWKDSFKVGVARIMEKFNPSNPLLKSEIDSINKFFSNELDSYMRVIRDFSVKKLIGASGAFETFYEVLYPERNIQETVCDQLPLQKFLELHNTFVNSTTEERLKLPGMEPLRVNYIPLASLFTKFILETTTIDEIWFSDFALKEGALVEELFHAKDTEK